MYNQAHLSVLPEQQAARYGDKTALTYKNYDTNQWEPISYHTFSENVTKVSRAFLHYGLQRKQVVAVFSNNKPECLMASFGAYGIGVVTTPFYPNSSGSQVTFMMNHAEVRVLFVGEQAQYDTALSVMSHCNHIEQLVIFDRKVVKKSNDKLSIYFDEFLQVGEQNAVLYNKEISIRKELASFDDLADILYTSGTTGQSKGVMITYKMYKTCTFGTDAHLPTSEHEVFLNFLPFTHIFERVWSYYGLALGCEQAVNLRPQEVLQSLKEVRPTCMCSVPRFWEKMYQGVQEKIRTSNFAQRKLMQAALDTGVEVWTNYFSKQKPLPLSLRMKYAFYNKTIYPVLRRTLGLDKGNFFPTAGAAVLPEVEAFVHGVGIYMMVGYGLTESCATVSHDNKDKPASLGSSGRPMPGIEIKISHDNEICLRGDTITPGYYKNEEATTAAFDEEGFFRTGDAGYLKDGELFMTERLKDLFKTSNGKYIAPQMLESKFVVDRYIEQCVIVADGRKFVSALIVPNYELLEQVAAQNDLTYSSREELCANPRVYRFLETRINTLQQDLASYEKIKKFIVLSRAFTVENGELTNTLKTKRNVIYKNYAEQINALYAEA